MKRAIFIIMFAGFAGSILGPVLFNVAHAAYVSVYEPTRGQGYRSPFWDVDRFIYHSAVASVVGFMLGLSVGAWMCRPTRSK